jgi:hypothetical protein
LIISAASLKLIIFSTFIFGYMQYVQFLFRLSLCIIIRYYSSNSFQIVFIKAQGKTQKCRHRRQMVGVLHCLLIQMFMDSQKCQNQIRVQEVQSGRQARGQGRQNGQAGRYKDQKQARVKTRRNRKRRMQKAGNRENSWLTRKDIQYELAQRNRKHRDKYTGENKQHLEGVETITRTGETDQGVTVLTPLLLLRSVPLAYISMGNML